MNAIKFIPIQEISDYFQIEVKILRDFASSDLIDIRIYEQKECVMVQEVEQIKRIINLYKGLGVNREGIEIILSMRDKILAKDEEIAILKHKLEYRENECIYRFMELPSQQGLLIDYDE